MASYTIQHINDLLKGELIGNTEQLIEGPEELQNAENKHITFIGSTKYIKYWADSKACAAVVSANLKIEPDDTRALIIVPNADLAMAKILELFNPPAPEFEVELNWLGKVDFRFPLDESNKEKKVESEIPPLRFEYRL